MDLLQGAISVLLLFAGGELLVRGATSLAAGVGVSRLAIGLTVVAFGTSAPELVVSLDAALAGRSGIALGNVVGSNIANIALILGLATLLHPARVEARILRVDAPIMLLASLGLVAVLGDGVVSRLEGGLLLVALLVYVVFTFREAPDEPEPVRDELAAAAARPPRGAAASIALVLTGLGLLVGGGHLLVGIAVDLARALGVTEAAIGLTIVAVGTSLPELATSVVASLRGQGEIAIGNVIGSNIFNILGILGATAVVEPLRSGGIGGADLAAMVGLAALLAPLLWTGRRVGRFEGAALLGLYAAYLVWLLARQPAAG